MELRTVKDTKVFEHGPALPTVHVNFLADYHHGLTFSGVWSLTKLLMDLPSPFEDGFILHRSLKSLELLDHCLSAAFAVCRDTVDLWAAAPCKHRL